MNKISTKQKILDAALELFSTQGFEATSVSQIADEVGIRKASIYSHFENKQKILEILIEEVLKQYKWHTVFSESNWDDKENLSVNAIIQTIVGQIRYIIHEPQIAKARKMLTIEQFRNPILAKVQTRQNYTNVMQYFVGLIEFLIRQGRLADNDSEIMAAQLCLPISAWINLCDRDPDMESEIIALVEKHIRQFFEVYQPMKV